MVPPASGKSRVEQALARVTPLIYLHSEDPVWFLLRAFRFTSRTGHGFVAAVVRDYAASMRGLAALLRCRTVVEGVQALSDDEEDVQLLLMDKREKLPGYWV